MNARLQAGPAFAPATAPVAATDAAPARLALLGTGNVGCAVLARLDDWNGTALGQRLSLVYAANTRDGFMPSPAGRGWREAPGEGAEQWRDATVLRTFAAIPLPKEEGFDDVLAALGNRDIRILIDATASDAVAQRHADWLARGIHVVTACKLGQGTSLARWRAIRAACASGNAHYGDSATVGAGLPLLRSIRELRAGGDCIHAIAGVLSGSLAWLFDRHDGRRPFAGLVREARDAGYTEPDPREDLSGEDVRRKLLILARAAGVELESVDVDVASLVPPALAALPPDEVKAGLSLLDGPLRERHAAACERGEELRFIARLERDQGRGWTARVGLESLPAGHPLAGGAGTDNRVAIWSDRYRGQPLLIQGPGAGAQVTAAALLDDVLRIANIAGGSVHRA